MRRVPLLLFLIPAAVSADQVFLKDAGSITGRIVEQTDATVKVDVGGGVIGVPMDRVDRIEKGRSGLDDYDDRAKVLAPTDVEGWKKLGAWAAGKGLQAQAHDAYKHVLKIAPNDPQANQALGRVEHEGKWMTAEESYRAQGYVQYGGEWMTPAQAQVEQTQDANIEARKDAEARAQDAERAAKDAEARAKQAEKEAREAQNYNNYYNPVWGGWGFGVNTWPQNELPMMPTFTPKSEILKDR